ncbi:MAG: SPASM domain-containing protein [Candidatus Taylorbacteria bacterium]|nr:SPASM domain-containing protein [Candidatus Taylorbacteria bacterium]
MVINKFLLHGTIETFHVGIHLRRLGVGMVVDEVQSSQLFIEWNRNPQVKVREFTNVLRWMGSLTGELESIPNKTDIFPTIGWNGDVVLLSPELLGARYDENKNFVVGNIIRESLAEILERGQSSRYVQEYRAGVQQCERECKFFLYCRGGQASNKFFELGQIAGTETQHCRNSQQKPLETILAFMENV